MLLTTWALGKYCVDAVGYWQDQQSGERAKDELRASIVRGSLDDVKESLQHFRAPANLVFRVGGKQICLFAIRCSIHVHAHTCTCMNILHD